MEEEARRMEGSNKSDCGKSEDPRESVSGGEYVLYMIPIDDRREAGRGDFIRLQGRRI